MWLMFGALLAGILVALARPGRFELPEWAFAALVFPGHHAVGGGMHTAEIGGLRGWLLTLAIAPAGALAGRAVRLPAGTLLGPMLVAGAITLTAPDHWLTVPGLLRDAGFA